MIDPKWSPLFQTIIWVLFLIFIIFIFRRNFKILIEFILKRIEAGSPITVGPKGFSIGTPPRSLLSGKIGTATSEGVPGTPVPEDVEETLRNKNYPEGIQEDIYLIHQSEVIRQRTPENKGLYRVKVWIESESDASFLEIKRVVYRLHDTFMSKVIATEAKNNEFELWLNVYGEFTIIAYVDRVGGKKPLWLTRYLDLPGRPPD